MDAQSTSLSRHIGLTSLILFGLGDILGAGVYGLIGKGAGLLGHGIWAGFLLSAVVAGFTAITYASLGSRYPRAAGAPYIVGQALGRPVVSYVIGLAIWASALTSMATATKIFVGYASHSLPWLPAPALQAILITSLTGLVLKGIKESIWLNNVCTIIEVTGLAIVIIAGATALLKLSPEAVDFLDVASPSNPDGNWTVGLVFSGALLTFYSFVGFEDILNVSEELKEPERNLPRGLLISLFGATLIYLIVSLVAVVVVPPSQLSQSSQPLVDVVSAAWPWFPPGVFRLIAMFAVLNTMLLNFIMASRLAYGMSGQNLLPEFLGQVHSKWRTPHLAILLVAAIWLVLTLTGEVGQLARATSLLLLTSYALMNISLVRLNMKKAIIHTGAFRAPSWVGVMGALFSFGLLFSSSLDEWYVAGAFLVVAVILYVLLRPDRRRAAI